MNTSNSFLNKKVLVEIDRPLGSKHPKWGFEYKLNYGFIPNTISGDGEELDAYVIGVDIPMEKFTGICIAVIKREEEDDDKLIVAPEGMQFTESEIRAKTNFQEKSFNIKVVFPE